MVKKLSKGSALMCSACLSAVDRVEGLIEEEPKCPACIHPWWAVCVKGRVVPEERQEIDDYEAEAGECYLLACEQYVGEEEGYDCTRFGLKVQHG